MKKFIDGHWDVYAVVAILQVYVADKVWR